MLHSSLVAGTKIVYNRKYEKSMTEYMMKDKKNAMKDIIKNTQKC